MLNTVKTVKHILEITIRQEPPMSSLAGLVNARSATIILENGIFKTCRFSVSTHNNYYTYDDWMFLKAVAQEIEDQQLLIDKHGLRAAEE
jgi:hypothetical protein